MWSEIDRLSGEQGITVLLTTHYLEEADQLASQLAIVDRGQIVGEGTPDELKRELRGDAIQVDLAGDYNGAASAALDQLAGVGEVTIDGRALRAAHPQTELTTTSVVPGVDLIASSTAAVVRSSWTPRRVNSWRIGATNRS